MKLVRSDELGEERANKMLLKYIDLLKKPEPIENISMITLLTGNSSRNTKAYYMHLSQKLLSSINIFLEPNDKKSFSELLEVMCRKIED